jgi:two-component system chemotaxis sensor kinase CheA
MAGLSTAQLQTLFAEEAAVRLAELSRLLLELEQSGDDRELIRSIYRELHTLKGSSGVAGLDVMVGAAGAVVSST